MSCDHFIIPTIVFGVLIVSLGKYRPITLVYVGSFRIILKVSTSKLSMLSLRLQQISLTILIFLFLMQTYQPNTFLNLFMMLEQTVVTVIIFVGIPFLIDVLTKRKSDKSTLVSSTKINRKE